MLLDAEVGEFLRWLDWQVQIARLPLDEDKAFIYSIIHGLRPANKTA